MASTASLQFWQKPENKVSFEKVSDFDLFYQLTYMSAVAAAGISRGRIFDLGAKLPLTSAPYFERAFVLAEKFSYDYTTACQSVGSSKKIDDKMRSLMLRLSGALTSGQPEAEFLAEEAQVQGKLYEKQYERDLSSLTKWSDAYAAINVSSALIIIINLTSMLIYNVSANMTAGLAITAVFTASAGAWVLSRAAPREIRIQFLPESLGLQSLTRRLLKITIPVTLVAAAILLLLKVHIGVICLVVAALIFPLGLVSIMAGSELEKKDNELGTFLRTLGGTAVSTGTTLSDALNRLDLQSYPALQQDLARLRARLNALIEPELCWHRFTLETGSKLIGETVNIFIDAVKLGGDPDIVALLAADFCTTTNLLRAKRQVVAGTLSWLTIIMHGAIAMLMVLILEVMGQFMGMIADAMGENGGEAASAMATSFPVLGGGQMEFLRWMTLGMVLLLAAINAFAIIATDGDHEIRLSFYLSLLLAISGVSFLVVPPLVANIFLQI